MSYSVAIGRSAQKEVANLHPDVRKRVLALIDSLTQEPRPPSAEPLSGRLKGQWKARVGDYRVIYVIDDSVHRVWVNAVGPRGRIYS